jgi:hypothetical protein
MFGDISLFVRGRGSCVYSLEGVSIGLSAGPRKIPKTRQARIPRISVKGGEETTHFGIFRPKSA